MLFTICDKARLTEGLCFKCSWEDEIFLKQSPKFLQLWYLACFRKMSSFHISQLISRIDLYWKNLQIYLLTSSSLSGKGVQTKNLTEWERHKITRYHQNFKILVPIPHNEQSIMGGMDKNFSVLMLQAEISRIFSLSLSEFFSVHPLIVNNVDKSIKNSLSCPKPFFRTCHFVTAKFHNPDNLF